MVSMDALRVGRSLRALRIRAAKRQLDVGAAAGVSRQLVAKVEAGQLSNVRVGALVAIGEALGASIDVGVRWHGEGLDRLLDAAHAGLVEQVVGLLAADGWETAVEVSFAIRGERGSVDVVGLRREVAAILIVEVKSIVPDAGGMLHVLDRKARLGPEIAKHLDWPCASVSRLLVIGDSSTTRRRIAALGATFSTAFPERGWSVRRWLRSPTGALAGLLFLPFATGGGTSRGPTGVQRVRRRKSGPKSVLRPPAVASGRDSARDVG
jgi:transcriptional regulator with XRE-family HTH domain